MTDIACPICNGSLFVSGLDAPLLTVVVVVPFNEPCIHCGLRLSGTLYREDNGEICATFGEMDG